jgi:membrane protease subunit HflC
MTAENSTKIVRHWPTMLLGIIVAFVFLIIVFSFQVQEKDTAVVTTFGKIENKTYGPGLHFRWPYPIQVVFKFDHRDRSFSGNTGKLEETLTADGQNVIVGIFVNYNISNAKAFYKSLVNIETAEDQLNSWMRSAKDETIGRYSFNQLINVNPKKMKLGIIEQEILNKLKKQADPYGLSIKSVGIMSLNVPKSISEKVFDRMIQERKVVSEKFRAEGQKEAEKIRIETDSKKRIVLAEAEAKAKEIRAQGDADAAKYYAVFKKSPDLAAFLRKLDSLRKIMKSKTTLILDTDSAPFDILKLDADKLKKKVSTGK